MDRQNVDVTADRAEGWSPVPRNPTVVIMDMQDEEEERLWDEIAGLTEISR